MRRDRTPQRRGHPHTVAREAVAAADPKRADRHLKGLREAVDRAIACAPTEGFLWLIRYWVRINQGAEFGQQLEILVMSYVISAGAG